MVGATKTLILVTAITTTLVVGQDSQDYSYNGGDYGAYSDNNYYGKKHFEVHKLTVLLLWMTKSQ